MEQLSDELLLEVYQQAVEFGLSPDFITLLEAEIKKRGL